MVQLYKGVAQVMTLETPNTIFEEKLATFMVSEGLNQNASAGFIELYTLPMKLAQRAEKTALISIGKRSNKVKLLPSIKSYMTCITNFMQPTKTHKISQKVIALKQSQ